MAESSSTASISSEFWHRNLVNVPSFTNAFIEKMASENFPVKVTLTRGYQFFHESYIHDVEGKLPALICIEHLICTFSRVQNSLLFEIATSPRLRKAGKNRS